MHIAVTDRCHNKAAEYERLVHIAMQYANYLWYYDYLCVLIFAGFMRAIINEVVMNFVEHGGLLNKPTCSLAQPIWWLKDVVVKH